jgi:hypothetical protein
VASARRQAHGRGVDIMTNSALTGATYDIDGGEQLISPA